MIGSVAGGIEFVVTVVTALFGLEIRKEELESNASDWQFMAVVALLHLSCLVSHVATKSDATRKGLKKGIWRSSNIFSLSKLTNIYKSRDRDRVQQYLEHNLCRTGS